METKEPPLPAHDFDTLINYGRLRRRDASFALQQIDEDKLRSRLKTERAREAFDDLRQVNSSTEPTNPIARRAVGLK